MCARWHEATRWLAAGTIAAQLCALAIGCGPGGQDTADTAPSSGPQPEQKLLNYRLIESEAGVRRWALDSDEMTKFPERQDVDLVRVKMDFFQHGEYFSTLVSDSGRANLKTRDVFVWGRVMITTREGRRLRTSELHFSNVDGLIRNDVYNEFDHGPDILRGIGLEATPDLDYIEIRQEVDAVVGDETVADDDGPSPSPAESP